MQSKIPLYPYNAKDAMKRGEIEKWRESFRENCACAGGIDILIRENFDGMHLKNGTVEKIVELYGYKRVEHVLRTPCRNGAAMGASVLTTELGRKATSFHPTKYIITASQPEVILPFWMASFQTTESSSWILECSTRSSANRNLKSWITPARCLFSRQIP